MNAEKRIRELGLKLPPPWRDGDNRVRALTSGNHVYMSGHGPLDPESRPLVVGRLGADLTAAQGAAAARQAGLACLGTLRGHIGDLDRVVRVVRALGFVNCVAGFRELPPVMNGFSDLMVEVFGPEIGRHTRSVIGIAELYAGMPVEIETVFEIR